MRAAGNDAIGVLRWGLARYRWLLLACLLVGAVAAPLIALERTPVAEARALVTATRLEADLRAIPRYGEVIFSNGSVADAVAANYGDAGDAEDIIPDRVSIVAEQDSIVFGVIGRDADPKTAADIANTAADAFALALNDAGTGVGTFEVQNEAITPPAPKATLGTVFAIPVGLMTGLVLGLAAVSLLLVARRPVVEGADAEELTGVPALGTVTVPRTRKGRFARPEEFDGLVPVCRRLLTLPTPTVVLVSRRKDEEVRMNLAVALVGMLRLAGKVQFVGPAELGGTEADGTTVITEPRGPVNGRYVGDPARLTVVDGGNLLSLVQPPDSTATVLVVPEGIGSSRLRAAVVEHLGGSAESRILLVKPGRRTRGNELTDPDMIEGAQVRRSGARVG